MNKNEKSIIIFDDDEDIVSICRFILEDRGWKVFDFADCIDPIHKVESIMPDLILMDNWIPDEGGVATTQKLKLSLTLKHIPVIFFSASGDIQNLAATANADAYLSKPFDIDLLEQIIDKHLASPFR